MSGCPAAIAAAQRCREEKGTNELIVIEQRIDPDSRTATRGSAWVAETVIGGQRFSARSRSGAPFELARQLVAVGLPDQPVEIFTQGVRGCVGYRSLHKIATLTIAESATKAVRTAKWSEFSSRVGKTGGERGKDDDREGSDLDPHKTPDGITLAAK